MLVDELSVMFPFWCVGPLDYTSWSVLFLKDSESDTESLGDGMSCNEMKKAADRMGTAMDLHERMPLTSDAIPSTMGHYWPTERVTMSNAALRMAADVEIRRRHVKLAGAGWMARGELWWLSAPAAEYELTGPDDAMHPTPSQVVHEA